MPLELIDSPGADSNQREGLWTLNFGPQHPATHTTLRLVLQLDGEMVVDAEPTSDSCIVVLRNSLKFSTTTNTSRLSIG